MVYEHSVYYVLLYILCLNLSVCMYRNTFSKSMSVLRNGERKQQTLDARLGESD